MSKSWKSFVEACLAGEARADEIDQFVDQWHESDFGCSLADYLGFSDEEYAEWVENPQSLSVILFAHQHHVPFQETLTFVDDQVALAAHGPAVRRR